MQSVIYTFTTCDIIFPNKGMTHALLHNWVKRVEKKQCIMGRTPQQPRPIAVERDRTRVQGHLVYQKEKFYAQS